MRAANGHKFAAEGKKAAEEDKCARGSPTSMPLHSKIRLIVTRRRTYQRHGVTALKINRGGLREEGQREAEGRRRWVGVTLCLEAMGSSSERLLEVADSGWRWMREFGGRRVKRRDELFWDARSLFLRLLRPLDKPWKPLKPFIHSA